MAKQSAGIHDGHRQRVKQKFLSQGLAAGTPPHQILEMLLFYSIPRKDTNEIAHALMDRFGSLSGVFDAPVEELIKVPGITENSACLIKLILPIARQYLADLETFDDEPLNHNSCIELLSRYYFGLSEETVYALFLDPRSKLIAAEVLASGNNSSVLLSMKLIIERVLKYKATGVVLAHNHPMGFAFPSDEDLLVTRKIFQSLREIDVQLIDHVIFAGEDCVSLAISKQYSHIFNP